MDPLTEKKWFLYINDHHEGPLSVSDIRQRVEQGLATPESFVWQEGMPAWQIMKEQPEFASITPKSPQTGYTRVSQNSPLAESQLEPQVKPEPEGQPHEQPPQVIDVDEKTGDLNPEELNQTRMIGKQALLSSAGENESAEPASASTLKKSSLSRTLLTLIIPILLISSFGVLFKMGHLDPLLEIPFIRATIHKISNLSRPYLIQLTQSIPALENVVPPLLRLEDVSMIEYEELHSATSEPLKTKGPQYALAIDQSDPYTPSFYIGSNLPEGAQFDLYIIGLPDTLLNEVYFSTRLTASLSRNIAKTQPLRKMDGKPIARGEYELYLISSQSQGDAVRSIIESQPTSPIRPPTELPPGSRILFVKKYFLGGTKDAAYLNKLRDFHAKLRARALTEVNEIKQHASILDQQLQSLMTETQSMSTQKVLSAKRRKNWEIFITQWERKQTEMNQLVQSWTPESLQNEYYYGVLYTDIQSAAQSVWKLYESQMGFMSGQVELQTFLTQFNTLAAQANEQITRLFNKIKSLEGMPQDDSRIPKRI